MLAILYDLTFRFRIPTLVLLICAIPLGYNILFVLEGELQMKNDLSELKHSIFNNNKATINLIIYGVILYLFTFLLESGINYILFVSCNHYEIASFPITFIGKLLWSFLYIGAVNYFNSTLNKKSNNIFNFLSCYKNFRILKSSFCFGLILASLGMINTNLERSLISSIHSKSMISIIIIIFYFLPFIVMYFLYRLVLMPYIIILGKNFSECVKLSFKMTRNYKYVGKWFILLNIVWGILGALVFYVISPLIISSFWPIYISVSINVFAQSIVDVLLIISFPMQIIGYQICMQHLVNEKI